MLLEDGDPEIEGEFIGTHKQFRHRDGRGTTVPFHADRDISPILLKKIAKDIKLTVEEFLKNQ
ncbi:MAG: hypothetical protein B1H12_08665 [Desulfobacteraceae bacterium 4484_190.2]|nr:MAG: hypothetical protein B1H12_08665 [Desulfobacteraceae bacterium 4484_190.2]